ncbi:pyridoxal-phosphate dependent enzyme [Gordonibacter sp. 28C]|uniref:pyridoxal-phosphate dependent enzyme n=1 Tax=Gordonibacter sp. 28C TaxID=2078569 RepID=UPI002105B4F3|nr:pyridoxal-phosphate dependent enzyme [Gordonibacter sp. 28C]
MGRGARKRRDTLGRRHRHAPADGHWRRAHPRLLDQGIYDDICIVSDEEALDTARALAREEGLLCGVSSGTNVAAARRLARKLGPGKTVVTLLPDTGERYFSTALFDGE